MSDADLTANDLNDLVRLLDLVPIPAHLMPRVLEQVQQQRAALRRFAESGIDVSEVRSAQVYRLEEGTR